jgi:two-component system chemotaxis response regulator CheY
MILILCVEDEPEVREALYRDLKPFGEYFRLEAVEDAEEAGQVMQTCTADGDPTGLVLCDHVLPGVQGVDFLVSLQRTDETRAVRKVLITGQAGLEDTIKAVNQAHLDYYIAKPWEPEDLHRVVRDQLTDYVLEKEENLLPYLPILDPARLLDAISRRTSDA